jgi:hypothetical protein
LRHIEEGSPARGYGVKPFDQVLWTDLNKRNDALRIRLWRRPDMQVLTYKVDHFLCVLDPVRILLHLRVHG